LTQHDLHAEISASATSLFLRSLVGRTMAVVLHATNKALDRCAQTIHTLNHALHGGLKKDKALRELFDDAFQTVQISFEPV
jgi:hypothetical protein